MLFLPLLKSGFHYFVYMLLPQGRSTCAILQNPFYLIKKKNPVSFKKNFFQPIKKGYFIY